MKILVLYTCLTEINNATRNFIAGQSCTVKQYNNYELLTFVPYNLQKEISHTMSNFDSSQNKEARGLCIIVPYFQCMIVVQLLIKYVQTKNKEALYQIRNWRSSFREEARTENCRQR